VIEAFHMLGNGAGTQQNQAAMGGVMSTSPRRWLRPASV